MGLGDFAGLGVKHIRITCETFPSSHIWPIPVPHPTHPSHPSTPLPTPSRGYDPLLLTGMCPSPRCAGAQSVHRFCEAEADSIPGALFNYKIANIKCLQPNTKCTISAPCHKEIRLIFLNNWCSFIVWRHSNLFIHSPADTPVYHFQTLVIK